jgi:hypothetical protein
MAGASSASPVYDLRALRASLRLTRPDLLLVDWDLLGSHAGAVLTLLRTTYPHLRVIVLSG